MSLAEELKEIASYKDLTEEAKDVIREQLKKWAESLTSETPYHGVFIPAYKDSKDTFLPTLRVDLPEREDPEYFKAISDWLEEEGLLVGFYHDKSGMVIHLTRTEANKTFAEFNRLRKEKELKNTPAPKAEPAFKKGDRVLMYGNPYTVDDPCGRGHIVCPDTHGKWCIAAEDELALLPSERDPLVGNWFERRRKAKAFRPRG